jgi:hypothetical protein
MTVSHQQPYSSSLFPRLNIKLKGHHFDIIEVIEAESVTALSTLTVHDFQDAFKKWQKLWGTVHTRGRDYFEGDGGQ